MGPQKPFGSKNRFEPKRNLLYRNNLKIVIY